MPWLWTALRARPGHAGLAVAQRYHRVVEGRCPATGVTEDRLCIHGIAPGE